MIYRSAAMQFPYVHIPRTAECTFAIVTENVTAFTNDHFPGRPGRRKGRAFPMIEKWVLTQIKDTIFLHLPVLLSYYAYCAYCAGSYTCVIYTTIAFWKTAKTLWQLFSFFFGNVYAGTYTIICLRRHNERFRCIVYLFTAKRFWPDSFITREALCAREKKKKWIIPIKTFSVCTCIIRPLKGIREDLWWDCRRPVSVHTTA